MYILNNHTFREIQICMCKIPYSVNIVFCQKFCNFD